MLNKILIFISNFAFIMAISSVNLVSMKAIYQQVEPDELKKYKKH